jgi:hypothetical protein
MSDHDRSLIDQVKDALGMGGHRDDHHGHDHDSHGDHTDADEEPHRLGDEVGVDGATQATGSEAISGGMGASAAMGGAGAGGPVGATPDPSEEITEPADGNRVRTEYEMGHELDPEHEQVAESGVTAERRGDAVVDTWREDDRPAE